MNMANDPNCNLPLTRRESGKCSSKAGSFARSNKNSTTTDIISQHQNLTKDYKNTPETPKTNHVNKENTNQLNSNLSQTRDSTGNKHERSIKDLTGSNSLNTFGRDPKLVNSAMYPDYIDDPNKKRIYDDQMNNKNFKAPLFGSGKCDYD